MSSLKECNNLLVHGYTRENTCHSAAVPIALIKLFELFYNDLIWIIDGKQYEKFKKTYCDSHNLIHCEHLKGPVFRFKNIEFQLSVVPRLRVMGLPGTNYYSDSRTVTRFVLHINADSIPKNISKFVINMKMNGNIFDYDGHGATEKYELIFVGTNHHYIVKFGGYQLQNEYPDKKLLFHQIIKKYNRIMTHFDIGIDKIKYNTMKTHFEGVWKLNKEQIKNWKTFTANKCLQEIRKKWKDWMMIITPFVGEKQRVFSREGDRTMIVIKHREIPPHIKYLRVKCYLKVKSSDTGECVEFKALRRSSTYCDKEEGFKYQWLNHRFLKAKKIKVSIKIDIVDMYHQNKNVIPKHEWRCYGFVTN